MHLTRQKTEPLHRTERFIRLLLTWLLEFKGGNPWTPILRSGLSSFMAFQTIAGLGLQPQSTA